MALKSGVKPHDFYSMSIDELLLVVKAQEHHYKKDLMIMNDLSTLILNGMSIILGSSKNGKMLNMYELHPELFKNEIKQRQNAVKKSETQIHLEKMRQFALLHNAKKGVN